MHTQTLWGDSPVNAANSLEQVAQTHEERERWAEAS